MIILPKKNEEVPIEKIREICIYYGLTYLLKKIEQDPPDIPFKSDGCSMWFNSWRGIDLYEACFLHDLKYWAGRKGESEERLLADIELTEHISKAGAPIMAKLMFKGVRIGGCESLPTSFRWGFGRTR